MIVIPREGVVDLQEDGTEPPAGKELPHDPVEEAVYPRVPVALADEEHLLPLHETAQPAPELRRKTVRSGTGRHRLHRDRPIGKRKVLEVARRRIPVEQRLSVELQPSRPEIALDQDLSPPGRDGACPGAGPDGEEIAESGQGESGEGNSRVLPVAEKNARSPISESLPADHDLAVALDLHRQAEPIVMAERGKRAEKDDPSLWQGLQSALADQPALHRALLLVEVEDLPGEGHVLGLFGFVCQRAVDPGPSGLLGRRRCRGRTKEKKNACQSGCHPHRVMYLQVIAPQANRSAASCSAADPRRSPEAVRCTTSSLQEQAPFSWSKVTPSSS